MSPCGRPRSIAYSTQHERVQPTDWKTRCQSEHYVCTAKSVHYILYSDDIALLSPSCYGVQILLSNCESYASRVTKAFRAPTSRQWGKRRPPLLPVIYLKRNGIC